VEKFRFLNWEVYRNTRELISLVLVLVRKLPREYRYELGSQIIRSSFSILLNIAEESGKTSDREMNRFIEVALGSVYETLAGFDVLRDNKLVAEEDFQKVYDLLGSISSQLGGFKKKLSVGRVS